MTFVTTRVGGGALCLTNGVFCCTTVAEAGDSTTAKRVRVARIHADLSRRELAQKLGTSATTITRIETGVRPVSPDELLRIGEACEVSSDFMERGLDAEPEPEPEDAVLVAVEGLARELRSIRRAMTKLQQSVDVLGEERKDFKRVVAAARYGRPPKKRTGNPS